MATAEHIMTQSGQTLENLTNLSDTTFRSATSCIFSNDLLFQSAFTSAVIGMALTGLDGKWLKVNAAFCDNVGYSEEELLQMRFQEITHPEDMEANLESLRRLIDGEVLSYRIEKRYLHKSGRAVWMLVCVSCMRNSTGQALFLVAQMEDITERKLMEQELKARNAELTEALNQIKQLRGILPICMYCKKVRDDTNYWHSVESFIAKHSDASFSHGVCPECLGKHRNELIASAHTSRGKAA
jgi:PAS domain S-box-containing protein